MMMITMMIRKPGNKAARTKEYFFSEKRSPVTTEAQETYAITLQRHYLNM